jgi:putative ABC transport system permease protein
MEDKVTIIMVTPVNADDAEELAREIEGLYSDLQVLSEKDAAREAANFTGQLSVMTWALGSIAAIIAGLGIMNVMFMSVRERRKEIGTMKAFGASTNEILMQVILEAMIITLIGEGIGLLLSVGAVEVLNSALGEGIGAVITAGLVINVTIFALVLAIISGLLPAREAAKLDPAVVLRYE